jgi:hypothetical protein
VSETLFEAETKEEPKKKAEKKQEEPDYSKWNLDKKVTYARVLLQRSPLKKSGYNPYGKFNYFELGDFLPTINEIFWKLGLNSHFEIVPAVVTEQHGSEIGTTETVTEQSYARLTITNIDNLSEHDTYRMPVADASVKGAIAIQSVGSLATYERRYLWLSAMEITENDIVDAESGADKGKKEEDIPTAPPHKITEGQKQILAKADPGRFVQMLNYYKVRTINDLTMEQASEAIKHMEANANA